MGMTVQQLERTMSASELNEHVAEWNLTQREHEEANKKNSMKPRRR